MELAVLRNEGKGLSLLNENRGIQISTHVKEITSNL